MGDNYDPTTDAPKTQCHEISSCGDCCTWIKENPRRSMAFSLFFVGLACIILAGMSYLFIQSKRELVFTLSGIGGFTMTALGGCRFQTLIRLKHEVDEYHTRNEEFQEENGQLRSEVSNLSKSSKELRGVQTSMAKTVIHKRENNKKFAEVNKNLEAVGMKNLEHLSRVYKMSEKMNEQWETELAKKQRTLLMYIFGKVDWDIQAGGVDRKNYNHFVSLVPKKYRDRLLRVASFDQIAGDDNFIQLDEFGEALDKYALEAKEIEKQDDHKE